jgi:uncharacterized membrane protein
MISDALMLDLAAFAAKLFELAGIGAIILGTLAAFAALALALLRKHGGQALEEGRGPVPAFRKSLGRSILVGLELLVAADIIRTVAIEPTLRSVAVLGAIVLIRTFLSFSLEVEIDGRWPWQSARRAGD